MTIKSLMLCGALACLAACGNRTETLSSPAIPVPPAPFEIVSGANVTDTVLTRLVQPLVVAVRTSTGAPRSGVTVRFSAVPVSDSGRLAERAIVVAPRSTALFAGSLSDTTDAQGRVSILVQFGTVAGVARVAVTGPESQTDTARFTVRAGSAASLHMNVRDTTLYSGESFRLATTRDRFDNVSDVAPTVSMASLVESALTVSDGVVRAASDFGRARFLVTGAGKTDSAFVSAAPHGTIAAYDYSRYSLTIVRLNGTRAVRFPNLTLDLYMIPKAMSWQADGSKMIATIEWITGGYGIYMIDTIGAFVPVVARQGRSELSRARFSLDGQWLYYDAQTFTGSDQVSDIYRVHPDGSGNELLFTSTITKSGFWRSPSPTASPQLLFVDGYDVATNSVMSGRLDVVTRTITRWPVDGFGAVYSPAADLVAIAPTDGRLLVMRPDGTGVRVLTTGLTSGSGTNAAPTWSPDGRWLLAIHPALGRYVIVRVSDGATVPITIGARYGSPAWRP